MAMKKTKRKNEDKFEMLARLIKDEGDDIRTEIKRELRETEQRLERRMDEGFASVNRRLDHSIQPQLDDHAHRLKVLERKVL